MNPCRILIVEDEALVAMEIEERLEAMGYQVTDCAASGAQALALAEEQHPDLALMDIRLQGAMDGITAAEKIRRRFGVPVIFLTAYSEDATLDRAKLAEPFGYILKPFGDRELKSTIEIALYKHRAEEEIRRLTRLYDVLSQVNQAIVRIQSQEELLPTVCRLVVERSEIGLAWIGWADPTTSQIGPVAHFGKGSEILSRSDFYAGHRPNGQVSPGKAILEGTPFVCNECVDGVCFYSCAQSPARFGFQSCGAFPLQFQGRICGVLCLCVAEPGFFRDHEIELLKEVAMDISFALDKIEGDTQRRQAEEALRESETRYRRLFEKAGEGIVLADAETGEILECNQALLQLSGYERLELIGKPQAVLRPKEEGNPAPLSRTFAQDPGENEGAVLSTKLVTKSGTVKQVEIKANVLEISGRKIVQEFFRDITAELRYHEEREATLKLLRILNDQNDTFELIHDLTGFLQQWTGCGAVGVRLRDGDEFPYSETRGFPAEFVRAENALCARDESGQLLRDWSGNPVLECMCGNILSGRFDPALPFFTPKGSFWTNNTTDLLANSSEADRQMRTRNRCNGEGYESVALVALRHGSETLGLLQFNDRAKGRFTPELIDFLEKAADQIAMALAQQKSRAALEVSEQRFRDISEASGEFIWEIDLQGCFTYLSERVETMLGYRQNELLGRPLFKFMEEAEAQRYETFLKEQLKVKAGFREFEHCVTARSGFPVQLSATAVPIVSPTGELLGFRGATLNVTERKRSEDALRESEERLRMALYAASMDAFEYSPATGQVHRTGSRTRDWRLPGEGHGSDYLAMVHPDDRKNILAKLRGLTVAQPNYTAEYRLLGPDGVYHWIADWAEARFDTSGHVQRILGVGADITERKQAEEVLRQRIALQDQLAKIAASVPGVVHSFRLRPDGSACMPFATPAIEDLFGLPLDVLTRDVSPFYANVHPDDIQHVKDTITEAARIPSPWHDQYRYLHPVKGERWIEGWSMPQVDPDGSILWHGFVMDVTERKQAEEERTRVEAQLRQAQKMEALGTLAGGIAHDFNNILGIIFGYTEMAIMDAGEGSSVHRELQEVLKAANRAKELVQQILAFSRRSEQEKRPVQVGLIVKEAMKMLRASLPSTIEIKSDVASKAVVMADPSQIHQVLMNLCTNAAHAMRDKGGVLDVSLIDVRPIPQAVQPHWGLQPGAHLRLAVADTGHGIDPSILDRIFDPFFTTKEQGVGTGLGLAVVHGIVKSYGGAIEVESLPGKGTIFQVSFPAVESAAVRERVGDAPLHRGSERILIVDDEPELAIAAKEMLERLGYEVDYRTNAIEALEIFRAQSMEKPFDLVITDMTMPHLTGADLVMKLRRVQPNLPAILCTGFSEKINEEKARSLGIQGLLMKPFAWGQLAALIRTVLKERM